MKRFGSSNLSEKDTERERETEREKGWELRVEGGGRKRTDFNVQIYF